MGRMDRLKEARRVAQSAALHRYLDRAAPREHNKTLIRAGGPGSADSDSRQQLFRKRTADISLARALSRSAALPFGIERRMGASLDLVPFAPSEGARRAGRPVARIVGGTGEGLEPEGFATGFLIAPDLLMTNWHVFPARGDANGCCANFLYERSEHGLQRGLLFPLDPTRFYISDETLDFAIVAVAQRTDTGDPLADLGQNTLIEARPKILVGQPVHMIQHPEGGPKQYAIAENRLVDILEEEGFLQYETDTLEGSSGAPAFSVNWELVALHHASIPEVRAGQIIARDGTAWKEEMGDDAVHWIANEGTRVSAIVKRLSQMQAASKAEAEILLNLLSTTGDPVEEAIKAVGGTLAAERLVREHPTPSVNASNEGSSMMTGVHFTFTGPVTINVTSGETTVRPELANAQAAASPAAFEKSIRFDPDYEGRRGYSPDFLDPDGSIVVPIPTVAAERIEEILLENGEPLVLKYHHFELVMNKARRLQMWSAANVDYDPARKTTREREEWGSDRWIPDPRIPAKAQIFDADFYKPAGNIDRGHIVRREDNEWGDSELEIEFANSDTFHWTNCTPQHEAFNQADPSRNDRRYKGMEGVWGAFENHLQQSRKSGDTKACILAGPTLADDDPSADFGLGAIQYPLGFWKIICVVEGEAAQRHLKAYGFIFSQQLVVERFGIERFGPGRFKKHQVALAEITRVTGVMFDDALHAADTMADHQATEIVDVRDIRI